MNSQTPNTLRRFLANRTAVVAAGTAGFLLGAGGFVAAQQSADDFSPVTTEVVTSIDDTIVDTTTDSTVDSTVAATDVTPASVDPSIPTTADEDTSSSIPGNDDNTSNSIDDATSTTIDDDDDDTSTSIPVVLPGPFAETYQSSGGSISVSWSGSAFSIDSISPASEFAAEIEENSWDRVRVDFEFAEGNSGEGHNDSRIEVRLHEGSIRVSID